MAVLDPLSRSRWRGYARTALRDDVVAACVVSVLLIPQSLAYALLAGLPAQAGLYASLLPLVAYAALGSSRAMGVGPAAVLALMISQALVDAPAGVSPHEVALVLAAEVGGLLALAAWWRLDALAALLSVPVLQGFETGATLSIAASQLPVLVGASAHGSSLPDVVTSWWHGARSRRRAGRRAVTCWRTAPVRHSGRCAPTVRIAGHDRPAGSVRHRRRSG